MITIDNNNTIVTQNNNINRFAIVIAAHLHRVRENLNALPALILDFPWFFICLKKEVKSGSACRFHDPLQTIILIKFLETSINTHRLRRIIQKNALAHHHGFYTGITKGNR